MDALDALDAMDGLNIVDTVCNVTGTGLSLGSLIAKVTQRKCSILFSNESSNYTLCNPCVYIKSGRCSVPLPPSIGPTKSGEALFTKNLNKANGSAGICTYDLLDISTQNSSSKVAVLFKVPLNQKRTPCTYAVGIVDASKECNLDLFDEMSKDTNATFVRGEAKGPGLTHVGQNVTITATMSHRKKAVMKVDLSDNKLSSP